MNLAWLVILCLLTGVLAGLLYFYGLNLTIRKVQSLRSPWLFFMGSFIVRSVLVLALFILVSRGRWQGLLACIMGFLIARRTAVWLWGPSGQQPQGKAG